jgi:phage baseplate assembly protein W
MPDPIQSIRFPIAVDEGRGRLRVETQWAEHVKQMIRQVLLTAPGERVHRPTFGAGLQRMVFAPNNETNSTLIQTLVREALERWLVDIITVDEVEVLIRDSRLDVRVNYTLRARNDRQLLELEVTV